MKILFCINSLAKAGSQRVVVNLANDFVKRHEVGIMTLTNFPVEYEVDSRIEIVKLDKKEDTAYRKRNLFDKFIIRPIHVWQRTFTMRKEIDRLKPDVIVSFLPEPSFLVLYNKKFNHRKIIVSVRNAPSIEYKTKFYQLLMRKLYPKADGFVFMTEDGKAYFDDILNCKSTIIASAISPNFIVEPFEGKRKKEIVAVGRLTEQKNFKMLIEAFSKLDKRFSEYTLTIYGEGEKRKELETQIEKLNLQNKVFLPGITENVKEKIYEASLYVFPSLYEGIGNALVEALCLGLPVIATDCPAGGPRSLIQNNVNGKLIQVGRVDQLVEAMEELLSHPEQAQKMGKEANKLKDKLSLEKINQQWEDFIKEIK